MSGWTWFWIGYAALGLIAEFIALASRVDGATLSENVWATRGSGFFSLILFFLIWMTYHFIFEGRGG